MTTFKSICIAGATALALPFLGMAASAQEALVNFVTGEDPFERSNAACLEIKNQQATCVRLTRSKTLAQYAAEANQSVEELIWLNSKAWAGQVDSQTVIPVLQRFRFGGFSDEQTS